MCVCVCVCVYIYIYIFNIVFLQFFFSFNKLQIMAFDLKHDVF